MVKKAKKTIIKHKRKRVNFELFMTREQMTTINAVIRDNRQSKHFVIIADVIPHKGIFGCAMICESDCKSIRKAVNELKRTTEPIDAVIKEATK